MSTSQDAIVRGTLDTANLYPAVGRLAEVSVDPATGSETVLRLCSATLVTPKWVLTARHCVGDHGNKFLVEFGPNVGALPGSASRSGVVYAVHTLAKSGRVNTLGPPEPNTQFDYAWWQRFRGADLALIKLDTPIDPAVIKPIHPAGTGQLPADEGTPLGAPNFATAPCVEGFSPGLVVGYGPRTFSRPSASIPLDGKRSYAKWGKWSTEYTRCDYAAMRVFLDAMPWETVSYCGAYYEAESSDQNYRGSGKGDSGGPLLMPANAPNRVCGVANSNYQDLLKEKSGIEPAVTTYTTAIYTAVDFHRTWIDQYIWNAKTLQYEGECAMRPGLADDDGDGVPNGCDLCPDFASALNGDKDGDGVGDVCDNCNTTASLGLGQRNSNLDVEIALKEGETPNVRQQKTDANYLTKNYPGDACDTVLSIPRSVGDEEATPPSGPGLRTYPRKFAVDRGRGICNTPENAPLVNAPVHTTNVFQLESITPAAVPVALANTLVEHCSCPVGVLPQSCNQEYGCTANRSRSKRQFLSASVSDRTNPASASWPTMAAPRSTADLLLTTHRPAPAADTTKTVAWAYWLDLLTLPPVPAPSPTAYAERVWNGLLSGWVHSFATVRRPAFNRVSGVTQPGPIADRRAAWLPFAIKESADNTDRGACVSQSPSVESVIPDILSQACPMCSAMPSVLGSIVNPVFNPIFTWATGASEATLVANAGISSIAANSLLTSVKTITAADAFAAAPASTVGMTTNASGAVTATIVTTAQTVRRVMPVMRAMALGPNGSSQPVPLGRVLSATKNEVAEFHANRVFHRALGSDKDETVGWTTPFRFGPIAGGAYVASNDSYLILDNPSANIWRMTAMARYGEPRVLAQWSFLRTPDSLTLDLAPTGEALITVNRENRASTLSVDWSPQGVTQATPFVHAGNVSRGVKLTAHGLEALVKTSTTLKHTATPIVGRPASTSSASANRALVETALRGLVP